MNNLIVAKNIIKPVDITNDMFSDSYTKIRKKEGRMYNDAELLKLPSIGAGHMFYKEWLIRKQSCKKLLHYIKRQKTVQNILEVGCGNGWLAAQLAAIKNVDVTGLDINTIELQQAAAVFSHLPNLRFLNGDITNKVLSDKKFDIIIFAASVQYFDSLKKIFNTALEHLTLQGEIHIIDTKFYPLHEAILAQQRTKKYYKELGFAEMEAHYFHHTFEELNVFQYKILYNPSSLFNKILFSKNPFPWIVIKNRYH